MSVLLDTHALVWWVTGDPRLSARAFAAIEQASATCFVSAISVFEIATKVRIGKLPAAAEISKNIDAIMSANGFTALPVAIRHAQMAGSMEGLHRDPFDRLLAAQSLLEGIPLITRDPQFAGFGVQTVW